MGLGHCLKGNFAGQAHLPRLEKFPSVPASWQETLCVWSQECGGAALKVRHQPNFFLTVVVCSDPTLSQAGPCSQSWPCHCECKALEMWNCLSGQVLIHLQANNSMWTNGSVLGRTIAEPDTCTQSPSPPLFTPSLLVWVHTTFVRFPWIFFSSPQQEKYF